VYAIIQHGGKQFRVEPGQVVQLEKIPAVVGSVVELDEVLLVSRDGVTNTGKPYVAGAKVKLTVVSQGKFRRILVFHYKAKKNIRKRQGHRQAFTMTRVEAIEV
jgi:large subunit ribosomal protein L21